MRVKLVLLLMSLELLSHYACCMVVGRNAADIDYLNKLEGITRLLKW
jgi:hypothetical protein